MKISSFFNFLVKINNKLKNFKIQTIEDTQITCDFWA